MLGEIEIEVEAVGASEWPAFRGLAANLAATVEELLQLRAIAMPRIRIVAAADLLQAITRESAALGLPPEQDAHLGRVGGAVAGKCLQSREDRAVTIVIPVAIATASDGHAQLMGASILSHELGHVLYATSRNASVTPVEAVWLPWEFAETLGLTAAEEYRVDKLANLMVEKLLQPRDDDGMDVLVASVTGPGYLSGLPNALDEVTPGLEDAIFAYRVSGSDLDVLWTNVARTTSGIALYLAHTEGHAPEGNGYTVATCEHSGVELLEPLWRPLFDHLATSPLLPGGDEWEADRARLREIGLEGVTEVWRRLGLRFRPEGESFYIDVGDPGWAPSA